MYGNIGAEKRIYYIFQFDETSISISTLYTNGGKKAKLEVEIDMTLVFTKSICKSSKPDTILIDTYKYDYERTKAPIENGTEEKMVSFFDWKNVSIVIWTVMLDFYLPYFIK